MSQKQEWVVILPDVPNSLSKRMEVRPDHMANLKGQVDSGFMAMGGATLDEPLKEGEGPKINGSVLVLAAETREEVWEGLKQDVYWKSGVWDQSKIQILPFKCAVRQPL